MLVRTLFSPKKSFQTTKCVTCFFHFVIHLPTNNTKEGSIYCLTPFLLNCRGISIPPFYKNQFFFYLFILFFSILYSKSAKPF